MNEIEQMKDELISGVSESLDLLWQEIQNLKRRIRETDERLSIRMLKSLEEVIEDDELFRSVANKFRSDHSFDAFGLEREMATRAKSEARQFREIYEAAKEFKDQQSLYNDAETSVSLADPESIKKVHESHTKQIASREKLFSLVNEFMIKEEYERQNPPVSI